MLKETRDLSSQPTKFREPKLRLLPLLCVFATCLVITVVFELVGAFFLSPTYWSDGASSQIDKLYQDFRWVGYWAGFGLFFCIYSMLASGFIAYFIKIGDRRITREMYGREPKWIYHLFGYVLVREIIIGAKWKSRRRTARN